MVEAAVYLGRTVRGGVPDWEFTIRGASGKTLTVRLTTHHVTFTD